MDSTHPLPQTGKNVVLSTLTFGHMVNDFYGTVLPFLLPTLILAFDLNFASAGLLALVTNIVGGILQPFSGLAGDRFGWRKRIIILGFIAFIAGLLLVSASVSFGMVLFAWLIYGLGTAAFHPQSTNFITRTFAEAKGRAMGIHGIGGAVGNFMAPILITALVTAVGWRWTSGLMIIPGLIAIILVFFFLKEPPRDKKDGLSINIPPKLWLLALAFGLLFMMYKGFLTFLPTYLVEQGSTLTQAGYITSVMFVVGFFAQPAGGYLYDQIGGRRLFLLSALLGGSALLIFGRIDMIPALVPIVMLGAAATALFPVSMAMASDIAGKGNVGINVGVVFGISGILSALTPYVTGLVADSIGLEAAIQWLIVLPIIALGVAFFLPSQN